MRVSEQKPLRNVYEFFLSLNLALAFVLRESILGASFLELRLKHSINGYLHLHPHDNVGGYGALFTLALGLALCIFAVVKFSSRAPLAGALLRPIGGVLSVSALPVCALLVRNFDMGAALLGPAWGWMWFFVSLLELCAAVVCVFLYLRGKWFFNSWQSVALLSVHWLFWGGQLFGPYFWRAPTELMIVAVGLSSCLLWGLCVSRQASEERVKPAICL